MAVAGAWALTLGIGPLARDSTHGAIHRAPGRRREQARERPGETWPNCGCAVRLEGVSGLARLLQRCLARYVFVPHLLLQRLSVTGPGVAQCVSMTA